MRRVLVAALVLFGVVQGAQQGAQAADMPFLRGSQDIALPSRPFWQGFYIGGQASYGASEMDFSTGNKDLLARLLNNVDVEDKFKISEWPLMGKDSNRNSGIGGFAGYNLQWDDVVIGMELSFIHGKFLGSSGGSQSRIFMYPDQYYTTATVTSTASATITDYGSARVRGAYAIGNFLPYLFAGVALGQADISRNASYSLSYKYIGTQVPPLPDFGGSKSAADISNAHFLYGYSAGLGVDILLLGNLFFRGEFEYLRFTAPVDISVSTVRGGLGYKF